MLKRIRIIDSMRGIAIIVMLFFHSNYYWDSPYSKEEMNEQLQKPGPIIAMFFAKFAGFFAVISGMANAYSIQSRLDQGKSRIRDILIKSIVAGLWIILLGRLHTAFLNHTLIGNPLEPYPDGPPEYSLIVGSMITGKLQLPSAFLIIHKNTALFAIGMSVFATGTLLSLLNLKEGYKKPKRNSFIIFVIATIMIILTEPLKRTLRPVWIELLANNQHLKALPIGLLIGDSYPIFPYTAFALYGSIFGILLQNKANLKEVSIGGVLIGATFVAIGINFLVIYGPPDISETFETLPKQWTYLQAGIIIWLCTLMYVIEFLPKNNKFKQLMEAKVLRRFGVMTLTIFLFEPIVGTSIKILILDQLFPGWNTNVILVFIYGISLIVLWYLIIIAWEMKDFKYSVEWLSGQVIKCISRRDTAKTNIKDHLIENKYA